MSKLLIWKSTVDYFHMVLTFHGNSNVSKYIVIFALYTTPCMFIGRNKVEKTYNIFFLKYHRKNGMKAFLDGGYSLNFSWYQVCVAKALSPRKMRVKMQNQTEAQVWE